MEAHNSCHKDLQAKQWRIRTLVIARRGRSFFEGNAASNGSKAGVYGSFFLTAKSPGEVKLFHFLF
jgi:hypothetical protein